MLLEQFRNAVGNGFIRSVLTKEMNGMHECIPYKIEYKGDYILWI